ncbi:glucose-6-phosphate dehydrogenase [Robiginitomaculum antarcticum]|uniref:glucose-6-phosphate dehydrogenase n=1 Tax=Robiginitomaculum antarcticum TaxID=437507 RepID=UPI0003631029|nr:glucose-6-phosphate dehydrogenase [Robiginitomaculum antarcticum]
MSKSRSTPHTQTGAPARGPADMSVKSEQDQSEFVPVAPFEMVIFGGTGDLARRKLIPSLYHRFLDRQFDSKSRIIAVSRSDYSRDDYIKKITEAFQSFHPNEPFDQKTWADFCKLVDYVAIDVMNDDSDWTALGDKLDCSACIRIFYLAMPPRMYAPIADGLNAAGLATPQSRVVLEKPIGKDYESAEIINNGVGRVFDENRIYRIDHYLGKETVQNLMVLRFANILFEPLWTRESIDHIQITAAESIGVAGREAYYDKSGALRDMVQNHLLQLLCLTCMEPPDSLDGDAIRTEKIKVLKALRPITPDNVASFTVRGQYAPGQVDGETVEGYIDELIGDDNSDIKDGEQSLTETFVAIKTEVENWRWAGVPIYLRTGKRMSGRFSEIVVQFKPVPHSVFGAGTKLNPNRLVIRLQPDESVNLWVEIKEPGAGGLRVKSWPLDLTYDEAFTTRYPDAYERLLMDVVRGRLALFMRRDEVEAAWTWVDQIQDAWSQTQQNVQPYPAGADGPGDAQHLLELDKRTWWSRPDV